MDIKMCKFKTRYEKAIERCRYAENEFQLIDIPSTKKADIAMLKSEIKAIGNKNNELYRNWIKANEPLPEPDYHPLTEVEMKLNQLAEHVGANGLGETLIDFLFYLNNKGLIDNHDFEYKEEAERYIASLK